MVPLNVSQIYYIESVDEKSFAYTKNDCYEIKYISRPYRLKPINPDSLKKLHFPQIHNEFNTNNIFENSYQILNNLFISDHKLKRNNQKLYICIFYS